MNPIPIVGVSGSAVLWYLARASGITAMVLLTLTVAGGIVTSVRWSNARWPRFATQLFHRNVSLLAVVFIGLHIATVVVDGFAPIGWKDALIPFMSGYRPLWLGLGAIGFDLVLALIVTSLLRHRIGQRTWRFVHWFAYVCWPILVVHGLAAGTDTKVSVVLVINVACIALVVLALWWRLASGWPNDAGARLAGLAATLVVPLLLGVWLSSGPLALGWARKAGTPGSLLASGVSIAVASTAPTTSTTSPAADALPAPPFTAQVNGVLTTSPPDANGLITLRLNTRLSGGATGVIDIVLQGEPTQGGGVAMAASRVRLGTETQPALYDGQVTTLQGNTLVASMHSSTGPALDLTVSVQIDRRNRVTGRLRADLPPGGQRGDAGAGAGRDVRPGDA